MSATDMLLLDDQGKPTFYLGPDLRESLPPHVLDGLARRRVVALGRACPCGARLVLPNRAAHRAAQKKGHGPVTRVPVEHEDDCPAICDELLRWGK